MKSPIIHTKLPPNGFLKFGGEFGGILSELLIIKHLGVVGSRKGLQTRDLAHFTPNPQTTPKLPPNGGAP